MKHLCTKIILAMLISMMGNQAFAHDIAVRNTDGVTIYYRWNQDKTELTVSYRGSSSTSYDEYSGNVTIPESVEYEGKTYRVTSIGTDAFYECSRLTSVTIPNSVTSIGKSAFYECSRLTSVTIPNSVTSIVGNPFSNCIGLTSIVVESGNTVYDSRNNCNAIIKTSTNELIAGCKNTTILNSVTSIGEMAFLGCSGLTSVVIGSGVTSIGSNSFSGTNLKKTIWLTNTPPSNAGSASGAMNYVSNNQFRFSNQVVYPFLSSYFDVEGIRYVPVSPSERTCDAIDCVYNKTAAHTNIPSTVTFNGIALSVQKIQPYTCYENKFIESLNCNISGEIPDYAFTNCSNMKNMTLGNKITSIGKYAFSNCSNLPSAKIPDGVIALNDYSFSKCISLSRITIPKAVKTIGNYVFSGCKGIKELIIEDREEALALGSNGSSPLFADCPLDNVYIGGDINYNTSKNYGYSPFYRNTSLRTVVITDKETEISANEFYGCTNLQSFTVGDGVTTFGDWAFSGCQSLKSLSFGTQLKTIGKEAFSDCTAVTEIVSKTATPPACESQALDDINKWQCKLFVPTGSIAAYQSADQWKEFFFVEEGAGSGDTPDNPGAKKCATPTISYSNGKLTFSCATSGAICQSTISDDDIRSYSNDEVQLNVTYRISVYATKEGYENSDVANATLCWIDVEPRTEGIANGVASVRANAVLIQGESGTFNISGADKGLPIIIYNTAGQTVGSGKTTAETTHVFTSLCKGEIGIVKIGQKAVKVMMK
ncbi:MAG: leucine-rich repeat domain-containing protein [Prevotella sp.]|nr:leucine-rich repeat domain-containing protein [Prevotella sp.]